MRVLKNIKHICLDKDGTIIDVHLYWADIIEKRSIRLAQYFNLPQSYVSHIALGMGVNLESGRILSQGPVGYKPRAKVIAGALSALNDLGVESHEDLMASIFSAVDQEMQLNNDYKIALLPGAAEGIRTLSEAGYILSCYSSDRLKNIINIFETLRLIQFFHKMIGGDLVKAGKPDAEGFLLACKEVGAAATHSVYIGDTEEDLMMARTAGGVGVGVLTGLGTSSSLGGDTEYIFKNLMEATLFFENGKTV